MKKASKFEITEKAVAKDKNFLYTIISYFAVILVFMNRNTLQSPLIGFLASVIYLGINTVFLGNALFQKESAFFRLLFGVLLLTVLLGFVGWLILIIYNLDVIRVALVLLIVTTFSSLLNKKVKRPDV